MDLRIEEPLWLLLFLPVTAYMVYTFARSRRLYKGKAMLLFVLRCGAIALLVFSLTSPYLSIRAEKEQVLFVLDRSASIEGTQEEAVSWIVDSLVSKQAHQSAGLYSFAASFRTDMPLSTEERKLPELEQMTEREATNIEKAIGLAVSTADKNAAARIVLLSDGVQTAGDIKSLLGKYEDKRIQIDTVLLESNQTKDTSISLFNVPRTAYENEQQTISVEVHSTGRTNGILVITQNDEEIITDNIELEPGVNRFSYKAFAKGSGLLKYEASIQVQNDRFLENNRMLAITKLQESPRVLIVQTEAQPSVIPQLLDDSAMQVVTINAQQLPETLSSYLSYSAIIFDNVPGHLVGEDKMTLIEQSVKNFGTGFMMVGGDQSFGLGGYFKSPLEKVLPVEMDIQGKERLPSLGLIIVMDRSGSMMGNKISLAREAAARAVELLRPEDTFGFIAFDDAVWEVIPTGVIEDKDKAIEKILSVPANGGTDIYPGIKKAYENLKKTELQRKHIILLTDGQSPMPPDYEELIENGRSDKVTMSTVAIGSDADWTLLEELADLGGGRFYDVVDESVVPSILTRETSMMTRTFIEDDPFYMTLGSVPAWNSLFKDGVPQMNAYIAATPKQTAVIAAESPKHDPIIAEWRYGLGKTLAFTSDSSGKWSGDLARWDGYKAFWNEAVSRMLPSYEQVPYVITHERGNTFTITDSGRKSAFLDIKAVNEKGQDITYTEELLGPGKTRVTLDADPGLVFFNITDDQNGMFEAGVSVPYSAEYQFTKTDGNLMALIAEQTGGRVLEKPSEAFRPHPFHSSVLQPLTQWLLLLAMILFFMDVTIRRFGLLKNIAWHGKRNIAKQSVEETEDSSIAMLLKQKKKR